MKPRVATIAERSTQSASVLVIVLWIAFGLVSLALYFGHSMSLELRATDNRMAGIEAEQAIAGAVRYVSNILQTAQWQFPGALPDPNTWQRDAVQVGDARFWLIGRSDNQVATDQPYFDLVDENSKLNVNIATADMLLNLLPRMAPELAAAIVDWRDTDSDPGNGGAEDDMYERLNPSYRCKNSNFESTDELRLVYGMDLDTMYGEDANLNGALDLNENDADQSYPLDNRDGRLDPGLLEYLTVFGNQPTTRTNGSPRVDITSTNQQALASLLSEKFDTDRSNQVLERLGFTTAGGGGGPPGGGANGGQPGGNRGGGGTVVTAVIPPKSVLEFYMKSGMTPTEFSSIEADIMAGTNTIGLVNVNTASQAVLTCIPGIGLENAPTLIAYRQNNRASLITTPSVAWVADVLASTNILQAAPYLTGLTFQVSADIAAVGHYGRGYRRVRFVFDLTQGGPRVIYRQDLTQLGWALGRDVRNSLTLLATRNRP